MTTTTTSTATVSKIAGSNLAYYLHFFSPLHRQQFSKLALLYDAQQQQFVANMQQLMQQYAIYLRHTEQPKAILLQQIYQHIVVWICSKSALSEQQKTFNTQIAAVHAALLTQNYVGLAQLLADWYRANCLILKTMGIDVETSVVSHYLEKLAASSTLHLNDLLICLDTLVLVARYDFGSAGAVLGRVYENYLKNLLKDKQYAQFFTPPAVADVMLSCIQSHLKTGSRVLDPACGAGALLLATGKLARQQGQQYVISGYDVSSFPLWISRIGWLLQHGNTATTTPPFHHVDDAIHHFLTTPNLQGQYDVVLANPPYLGYNACCQQGVAVFNALKKQQFSLKNIFGINLHSPPDKQKRYAPKPNLYAFFLALGVYSLRENGCLCYLIPQTLLTATDTDTLRHYLAKEMTIEKMLTFGEKMFVDRGKKATTAVLTSSMIVVARRARPTTDHVVVLQQVTPNGWNTVEEKNILQQKLLDNYDNWNFVMQSNTTLTLLERYRDNSESLEQYYHHQKAKTKWQSTFFFDPGYMVDYRKASETGEYVIPKLGNSCLLLEKHGYWHSFSDNAASPHHIRLRQSSQGYGLLHTQHKIVWSYNNPQRFHYIAGNKVLVRFQEMAIGSDNEAEILYLLGILNAQVTQQVLYAYLKNEHEKDFLLGLTAIKKYVRVPLLSTAEQLANKQAVIVSVKRLLAAEAKGDWVSADVERKGIDVIVSNLYFGNPN